MDVFEDFRSRDLVAEFSDGLREQLTRGAITAYVGFDPTAASLHVGSLLPVMALVRLQRAGHRPIAIVGGGTGMIGDPSGKTVERQLLTKEQISANCLGLRNQLSQFLDFDSPTNPARLINNADWLAPITLLEFLRDVGKHFTVNYMLAKESVRRRLDLEGGLSFTEFSYMLLQAYDYLVLHDQHGCALQMGGSDQWGNIVAGIELIRRVRGKQAHGLVFPLVTTSSGVKFGKTEAGNVWLDPALTSPFRFYQFWLRTDDRDVARYLKSMTLLSLNDIGELQAAAASKPEQRDAQRTLAAWLTRQVHGADGLARAEAATNVLFGGSFERISASEIEDIFSDVSFSEVPRSVFSDGVLWTEVAATSGLATSKSEARRLILGGGAYVNNNRVADPNFRVTSDHVLDGRFVILRKGSRDYHVLRVIGS